MSSYGVQVYADNGNSFLIPDKNPFTFHNKWQFNPVSDYQVDFRTDIPDHVNALFFCHNQLHSHHEHPLGTFGVWSFRRDGYWWIKYGVTMAYGAQTITVIAFTEVELYDRMEGMNYGLAVYDEQGRVTLCHGSKPLKMWIVPGPPVRPLDGFIDRGPLPDKYAILVTGWALNTHRGGTNIARCTSVTTSGGLNQVAGFVNGIGLNMTPENSWNYYNASNVICVRMDDY